MKQIDKDAILAAIDKERQILIEQERFGAEHVVVHHARRLIEDAPTIDALPVEWLKARKTKYYEDWGVVPVSVEEVLAMWQKEQEAR